jgi:hypothetical protein
MVQDRPNTSDPPTIVNTIPIKIMRPHAQIGISEALDIGMIWNPKRVTNMPAARNGIPKMDVHPPPSFIINSFGVTIRNG